MAPKYLVFLFIYLFYYLFVFLIWFYILFVWSLVKARYSFSNTLIVKNIECSYLRWCLQYLLDSKVWHYNFISLSADFAICFLSPLIYIKICPSNRYSRILRPWWAFICNHRRLMSTDKQTSVLSAQIMNEYIFVERAITIPQIFIFPYSVTLSLPFSFNLMSVQGNEWPS